MGYFYAMHSRIEMGRETGKEQEAVLAAVS